MEVEISSLTPKQAAFCTAFIECGNASEAYRQAYDAGKMLPATVHRKAKELLDNGKIAARLDQLRAAHVERHQFTVDDMIEQLDEDRAFARKKDAPAAAVSASMGKAKVLGFLTDKIEHGFPKHDLTAEQRAVRLAAIFAAREKGADQ